MLICVDLLCCRVRPIGSTSESDTEFDRMKQVGTINMFNYPKGSCAFVLVGLIRRSCFAGDFG